MHFPLVISTLTLASMVSAANFIDYDPQPGVQEAFRPFFQALINAAENPTVTTGFTNYFPADGMQTTLTLHCVGAASIQRCKNFFLRDGRQLVHFPNKTFVASNNATATTYESHGRIENTYAGGNCSQIYYKTQYTILKTDRRKSAAPNLSLKPEGQVYWYHDYFVRPTTVPSDIPCDSLKV